MTVVGLFPMNAMARYPQLVVKVQSENPLALVAAVREEMRRARLDPVVIRRFTEEALARPSPDQIRIVCGEWVRLGAPPRR